MTDKELGSEHTKLSWREGLYLVGPDPLTSPYYSSEALLVAGVGYATPLFQMGLYALLFLLAPLYVEAVLLTLSNGGTYVMTRYAMSHLGKLATAAAAMVGVIISFSYVATAIVSMLSYSGYLMSLVSSLGQAACAVATLLSAIPALVFGIWVMPKQWVKTTSTVLLTTLFALVCSAFFPPSVVIMLPPLIMLFALNNYGLRESVRVSATIFFINLGVMGITILLGLISLAVVPVDWSIFLHGAELGQHVATHGEHGVTSLPGAFGFAPALVPMALGSSILGASGVESVMNIPEDLKEPTRDVRRIYRWMLSILLVVGGSLSTLVFLLLPPDVLVTASSYLLAELGRTAVANVTGSVSLAHFWNVIIVVNAALILLGATNTGFAGARGLWVTMARDDLLPRFFLRQNERGSFERLHWLMLVSIFLMAWEAEANTIKLERWYGASFGLVMFSGIVAFILLRKYKAEDRRAFTAPWNLNMWGMSIPVAAIVGLVFLTFALIGLYTRYGEDIDALRKLLLLFIVLVGAVLLSYNHRTILRTGYNYFRRVVDSVETEAIESSDRTIVVAVGSVRMGLLIENAIKIAQAQTKVTGIPYRRVVVFHMTRNVRSEYVFKVSADSVRPAGIEGHAVRIFTHMTQVAPANLDLYLALVPYPSSAPSRLDAAMDSLVEFHNRHDFKGHIVLVGDYGVTDEDKERLQSRLEGSTLVFQPVT
jgi:amino acid transporter